MESLGPSLLIPKPEKEPVVIAIGIQIVFDQKEIFLFPRYDRAIGSAEIPALEVRIYPLLPLLAQEIHLRLQLLEGTFVIIDQLIHALHFPSEDPMVSSIALELVEDALELLPGEVLLDGEVRAVANDLPLPTVFAIASLLLAGSIEAVPEEVEGAVEIECSGCEILGPVYDPELVRRHLLIDFLEDLNLDLHGLGVAHLLELFVDKALFILFFINFHY